MAFETPWKSLTEHSSVRTISLDNSLTHQGKGFLSNTYSLGILNAAYLRILIVTPPDIDIHFRGWNIKSNNGPCYMLIYEGTVTSALGTILVSPNTNRQAINTSKLKVYRNPTVTTNGTSIIADFIGSSGGGAHVTVGQPAGSDTEWLLKRNTKYMIEILNSSGVTTDMSHSLLWYEI